MWLVHVRAVAEHRRCRGEPELSAPKRNAGAEEEHTAVTIEGEDETGDEKKKMTEKGTGQQ